MGRNGSTLQTVTSWDGDVATIVVSGKLTVMTSPQMDDVIIGLFEKGATGLRIDLSQLEYISSSGLRNLVMASKMAMQRGGKCILVNPSDEVYEVLEMTGLAETLHVERS